MAGNHSQETPVMCFSLEDIFEDIWEEPGNVSGFVHVFDQCTETSTSVHYLAGLLVMVGTGFHLCLDFQAV